MKTLTQILKEGAIEIRRQESVDYAASSFYKLGEKFYKEETYWKNTRLVGKGIVEEVEPIEVVESNGKLYIPLNGRN